MIDKVKEEIAQILYDQYRGVDGKYVKAKRLDKDDNHDMWKEMYIRACEVVKYPIISKALELYQKALDGKLVELEDDQNLSLRYFDAEDAKKGIMSKELGIEMQTRTDMRKARFRKVKELNIE